jgi:hypothetical protein
MGQKIHPHGLRVGITRKWNSSWFSSGIEWKKLFFYQKEVENFFKVLFYFYPYTKISKRKRVLLFDVKLFKYTLTKIFLFVFFYKLRTKRRKDVRAVLSSTKQNLNLRNKSRSPFSEKSKISDLKIKNFFFSIKTKLSK